MGLNCLPHSAINVALSPLIFAVLWFILPFFGIFQRLFFISGYLFKENMAGKVVLITGASSGIGENLAYEYGRVGARLVLVARRKEKLEGVAATARSLGSPDVLVLPTDVTNVNDCKRFIDDTIHHFGRLDHLVNNAGICSICALEEVTDITRPRSLMEVNFWGSVYPTYFAIPHLRKTKGKIVVNSSITAHVQPPLLTFYSSSKAALIGFFESLRGELGSEVSVSVVTLGLVESEMTEGKLVSENGEVVVYPNQKKRISPSGLAMMGGGEAAKAIVEAIRRGEKYVTEPKWYKLLTFFKYFCPVVIEWHFRRTQNGNGNGNNRKLK